jgi:predicted Holliday junction resolvase-like endonuclease
VSELEKCYEAMSRLAAEAKAVAEAEVEADGSASKKFKTFKMDSGTVKNFHEGLRERVGEPLLPFLVKFI